MIRIKIAAIQFNATVGAIEHNCAGLFAAYEEACARGADLVVAPEFCVTGYPLEDLVLRESFLRAVDAEVNKLIEKIFDSGRKAAFIFGTPKTFGNSPYHHEFIYNAAFFIDPADEDISVIHKQKLPNYGVFDEKRTFVPAQSSSPIEWRDLKLGLMICEDGWSRDVAADLAQQGADMLISINGSPFEIGKIGVRHRIVQRRIAETGLPFLYVNSVGGQDELVFDGGAFFYDRLGNLHEGRRFLNNIEMFEAEIKTVRHIQNTHEKTDQIRIHIVGDCSNDRYIPFTLPDPMEETYQALVLGLRDYLGKQGFKSVVLGYSGGVDSGLVAAIACDAIGPDNVHLVRLPSKFSSQGSLDDAAEGAKRLGAHMRTIDIEQTVEALRGAYKKAWTGHTHPAFIKHDTALFMWDGKPLTGTADENLQARARGTILMAISNQEGHILLSTGNKSEVSVGYCVDGNSVISTDNGLTTALKLFETHDGTATIKGHRITHAVKVAKTKRYRITTEQGQTLLCGEDHPLKVYDLATETFDFVRADTLVGNEVLVGSQFFCLPKSDWTPKFDFVKSEWDFRSPNNLLLPTKMDDRLATFLGVCVADGSYTGNGIYTITTGKQEVVGFCSEIISSCNASYKIETEDKITRVRIFSVEFCAWLQSIGVNHLSENKRVPEAIFAGSQDTILAFLNGILLDSSLNSVKNTTELCYNSKSDDLATEIHLLMGVVGVRSYLRPTEHERTSVYVPSYEQYKLTSLKDKNLLVMQRQDLQRMKPKAGIDNIYYTKSEMEELKASLPWHKRGHAIRRGVREGFLSLAWVSDRVKRGLLDAKWLKTNTRFLYIKKIEVEEGEFTMFDFSVEGIEQFEANGFTVHNCTLYGDINGGYNVLKDCYKTLVWGLCRWRNAIAYPSLQYGFHGPVDVVVPEEIINKPPSAELRENQQDSDSLPPYPVLDFILEHLIEKEMSVAEIVTLMRSGGAYAPYEGEVARIRKLVDQAEYKRRQAAPGVKVTAKIHGRDRRYPIVNHWRQ